MTPLLTGWGFLFELLKSLLLMCQVIKLNSEIRDTVKIDLNNLKFMRFGALSPVKQEGYSLNPETFHQPPARYGIYAFVAGQKESFLLGKSVFDQKMHEIIKGKGDENDHMIWRNQKLLDFFVTNFDEMTPEEREEYRDANTVCIRYKKPRIFKYSGELWHHLEVRNHEILKEHGSWTLTTFSVFCKAFKKEMGGLMVSANRIGCKTSKDHLEVFIERI